MISKHKKNEDFELLMKKYLKQAREKLNTDLTGTREAIKLIAQEKTKEFILTMDRGLSVAERKFFNQIIINSMYQSFCYGYGIGKVEGSTDINVFL